MSLQGTSTPPDAPSLLMCSLGSCPVHPIQSQQVEMAVHTLGSVHPPLGTIKRPPEFARCCTALSACLCTQQITSVTLSPQQLSSLLGLPSTCQDLTCGPSFSCQGEGCCMPHGACTLLRGPTNSPQRLLVAAYVATAMSLTLQSHCHLEWPPGNTASPNHRNDSWDTSLHDRASLPQHTTAWATNSPVTTVLICSQQTRTIMHTP